MTQIFTPIQLSLDVPSPPIRWSWVTLAGPDAKDFLQRLTTVNLNTLQVGGGSPGCFLNAQGKIRSYFTLWNTAPETYAFELDSGATQTWKQALLTVIDQFTFGEKMTLIDRTSELDCLWIFPTESELLYIEETLKLKPSSSASVDKLGDKSGDESGIQLCHQGSHSFGMPWITAWGQKSVLQNWVKQHFSKASQASFLDLERLRIQNLTPWVDKEITEAALPLEVGLRNTIADNKGCYPGQEVIEKILALGSPPRRLALIEGQGKMPHLNDPVQGVDAPTDIGKITSSISTQPEAFLTLGIVRKTHAKEGLEVQFPKGGAPLAKGKILKVLGYETE